MEHKIINGALVVASAVFFVISAQWIYGFLSGPPSKGNTGEIQTVGVGVYQDSNCVTAVTEISWGMTEPGSVTNVTTYIRNEGNTPSTLSLNTTDWDPVNASQYLTLTWSYGGHTVQANEVVLIVLNLSMSNSVEEIIYYSFDINIAATG